MPVTAQTAEEIFIGAGDVYVDGNLLGATMENNVFRVVQEKGTPDLNGVPGPLKGLDYIQSETAELEMTLPQISDTVMGYAVPGSVSVAGDAAGVPTGGGLDTTLAAAASAGATNIKVTSVTGANVGDEIMIGAAGSREFRKITTVGTAGAGGTGIDLNVALTSAHSGVATDPVVEVDSSTLAADAPAGSTNLKVTSVAGLAVGDYLRFGYPGEQEVRRLEFVGTGGAGGTGVSFETPTNRSHLSGQATIEQTSLGSTSITSGAGLARRIPSSAYHDWELRVPGLDGREVRFSLTDALMTEQPEYEASDDAESPLAPRLTLQARWDPAASTVSPWRADIIGPTV